MSPTPERAPAVHVARRGAGKTHALLEWLREGSPTAGYPGWSRVVVVSNDAQVTNLTVDEPWGAPWRSCVWTVRDLRRAFNGRVPPGRIQYAVDDADLLVRQALGVHQGPARLALHGEPVTTGHLEDVTPYLRDTAVRGSLALTDAPVVTEHAQEYAGGNMLVWPNDPELYEVFPLELRIESARRNGGHAWRRRVIVVEDWVEVTEP